jgi:hypothetical protein
VEGNNNPPITQTNGDVGIDGIKELDPGPIEDDDGFDSGDPDNCATGTMWYDFLSSQLVPSDHLISAFQQGHQEFPLFCPWSLFVWTIPLSCTPTFVCTHYLTGIATSIQSSIWGNIISMTSLPRSGSIN